MRSAGLVAVLVLSLALSPTTCRGIDPELRAFVSTLERYSTTKNDIVFLLESGNIEADHFPDALVFTETLARLFIVSPEYSRLTVMTSSDENLVHIDQVTNTFDANMCTFVHDVNRIQHRSGNTKTREALEHAKTILRDARRGVNRIIILISGALSHSGSETYTAAPSLKDDGVIIFCVGVADVNQQELSNLATTVSHAYFLKTFGYIRSVTRSLRRDVVDEHWDKATSANACERECDANAICACGARSGTYQCVCSYGYTGEGSPGQCEPVTCAPLKPPEHGYIVGECATTYRGKCVFECDEGFELMTQGSKIRTCQGNGTWSGVTSKCVAERCSEPPTPVNGYVGGCQEDSAVGTSCTIRCDEGYRLVGESTTVCTSSKTWTVAEPICNLVQCPSPASLTRTARYLQLRHNRTYVYKDTFWPRCLSGFRLRGPRLILCGANGQWEALHGQSTLFSCVAYHCPYYPPPKNGFVACDSETDRQFCSVYCDQGYEFAFPPAPLYRCRQKQNRREWSAFSRNKKLTLPWPDCAVSKKPKKTDYTVDFKFATNSCQVSEEQRQRLKKKFFDALKKKVGHVKGICDPNQGCTVDNVHIDCQ